MIIIILAPLPEEIKMLHKQRHIKSFRSCKFNIGSSTPILLSTKKPLHIRSDEGLTLETSVLESLHDGQ